MSSSNGRPLEFFPWPAGKVAYQRAGAGRPMILLHNAGNDHRIWVRQIEELTKSHTLYAVDLPGFGESAQPDVPYDLEFYVRFLRDFMTGLAIVKPVLVGNGMGSTIALELARRYPTEVQALILFNTLGGREMMARGTGRHLLPTPWVHALLPVFGFLVRSSKTVRRRFIRQLFGTTVPHADDPLFQELEELAKDPKQVRSRWNLIRGMDSFSRVQSVEESLLPPTLMLWGEANRVLARSEVDTFSEKIDPNVEVWLPGGGHLAMIELHEKANTAIRNFLESGPGKG